MPALKDIHNLTPKQAKFVSLYVECGNASEAYRKSYKSDRMKPETINRAAKQLLDNYNISTRISELRNEIEKKGILSKEEIINDLKVISSVTIDDYIHDVDPISRIIIWKSPKDWTEAMKRACTGIKNTAHGLELTVMGVEYAYNRIAKMMGYDAPIKTITAESTLADLLK